MFFFVEDIASMKHNVHGHLLTKVSGTQNSDQKYFLQTCKDTFEKSLSHAQWLSLKRLIQSSPDGEVFLAEFRLHSDAKVVVKVGKGDSIKREMLIAETLHNKRVPNTAPAYCWFTCEKSKSLTEFQRTHIVPQELCDGPGAGLGVAIVPWYPYRFVDIPDMDLSRTCVKQLVLQVFYALFVAFDACGFVHNDLHLNNILLQPSESVDKRYTFLNSNVFSVANECAYEVVLIDFGRSKINSTASCEMWKDLRRFAIEVERTFGFNARQVIGLLNDWSYSNSDFTVANVTKLMALVLSL